MDFGARQLLSLHFLLRDNVFSQLLKFFKPFPFPFSISFLYLKGGNRGRREGSVVCTVLLLGSVSVISKRTSLNFSVGSG